MKISRPLLALVTATLGVACALPPEEDPVLIRLEEIDRRVESIERVVRNESLLQIATELEVLREEVRGLRGATEALQYETEKASARQRDQYLDLDQRLQSLERRTRVGQPVAVGEALPEAAVPGVANGLPTTVGVVPAGSAGGDSARYQSALELLRQGRYPQAEEEFRSFLVDFPGSSLADNALYWLAETHYVNREFETARATFRQVLTQYPNSRKAPDALLKAGFCEYELKELDAAQLTLQSVVEQYPDSTAARLAMQRLDRISTDRR